MNHMLTMERNYITGGFMGYCECNDPDYDGDWTGYTSFEGWTQQDVIDQYEEHAEED